MNQDVPCCFIRNSIIYPDSTYSLTQIIHWPNPSVLVAIRCWFSPLRFLASSKQRRASDDSNVSMTPTEKHHQLKVATSFGLVYVLWGGTYLAMKVAVEHIPPYVMGAVRYLVAGPLMLGYLAAIGRKVRLNRQDLMRLITIGGLLLSIGNMGVAWAEEYVPSGLAALMVEVV